MNTKPNDLAFPITSDGIPLNLGLTKREYFAAMAMQGILADSKVDGNPESLARAAVKMADALINALNEQP